MRESFVETEKETMKNKTKWTLSEEGTTLMLKINLTSEVKAFICHLEYKINSLIFEGIHSIKKSQPIGMRGKRILRFTNRCSWIKIATMTPSLISMKSRTSKALSTFRLSSLTTMPGTSESFMIEDAREERLRMNKESMKD